MYYQTMVTKTGVHVQSTIYIRIYKKTRLKKEREGGSGKVEESKRKDKTRWSVNPIEIQLTQIEKRKIRCTVGYTVALHVVIAVPRQTAMHSTTVKY